MSDEEKETGGKEIGAQTEETLVAGALEFGQSITHRPPLGRFFVRRIMLGVRACTEVSPNFSGAAATE